MTQYKTLDGLDVKGKRVLVRADLNVPMKDGRVTDLTRIERTVPTLKELMDKGAKVVVLSHLGRPKGKPAPAFSLKPVADALGKIVGRPVPFGTDCIGPDAERVVKSMKNGDIALLENVRFHPGEEKNDLGLARKLAALGDVYVGDAFACAHRAHSSTEAVARLLPAAAGRLMQAELEALTAALESPKHPVCALVGGAKISTKMDVLGHLVVKVDKLIVGGAMANTFLYAAGIDVANSLCEKEMANDARAIVQAAEKRGAKVLLPSDAVVAAELKEGAQAETVDIAKVPAGSMILDVGPKTVETLKAELADCKTLVWNGPLGAFEIPPFDAGTNALAKEAARLTKAGSLLSVAGGGDTVSALVHAGAIDDFSYVSTAGGAFLEWLEGKDLPGVAVLRA